MDDRGLNLYFRHRKASRPARGTKHPRIQCVLGAVSPIRRADDHSLPSSAEIQIRGGNTSTSTHTVAACTEAVLISSLIFPMRATRQSKVQTIKLLTHYCEEYLGPKEDKGRE